MDSLISMQLISSAFTCLMHTDDGLVTAPWPEEVEVTWPSGEDTRDVVGGGGAQYSESQRPAAPGS